MSSLKQVGGNKMFGGFNKRFEHESTSVGCPMKFTIFFPPVAESQKVPVIYWLSGLTCTDENFIQKSFAQKFAAEQQVALVAPDTSPRGLKVEGESESWDFGVGAGFYLNSTVPKWKNWRMYEYVTEELPAVLSSNFSSLDLDRCSIMGHSMGGHGALTIFLKNPTKFKSVSAFAPICNPVNCPWGQKAFNGYLGENQVDWQDYDATLLVTKVGASLSGTEILIDQGDEDKFYLDKQLLPENFVAASKTAGVGVSLRLQAGYDHSYFFIASFIQDHIQHHASALSQ